MNKVCGVLVCLLLLGCALHGGDKKDGSTRLRFVPGSAPASPLEASNGAVWSQLSPFPEPDSDTLAVLADAAIGDKFPVAKKDGPTLFEVLLKDGDDNRVSIEILSKEGSKSFDIQRDKSAEVKVAGTKYQIAYPTVEVASADKKTTTNKAHLFVSTRRNQ